MDRKNTNVKKRATETYLKNLNPKLWKEVYSLAKEQRDQCWLTLTQKHLKDYKTGQLGSEEFKLEELKFLYLNYLATEEIPTLDYEMPQRGFSLNLEKKVKKFGNIGNFVETIKREAENYVEKTSKPFWILVGGVGISGKATLRNILTKELSEKLPKRKIISLDRDYQKIFPPVQKGDINIIEDVHGLDKDLGRFNGKEGLLDGYDLVVYCLCPKQTYRQNLVKRGVSWINIGKIDLSAPEKQAPAQLEERIKETANELERTLNVSKDWLKEHFGILKKLKNRGVKIAVVDPTQIFKEVYPFEEQPELLNKSFLEILDNKLKIKNLNKHGRNNMFYQEKF